MIGLARSPPVSLFDEGRFVPASSVTPLTDARLDRLASPAPASVEARREGLSGSRQSRVASQVGSGSSFGIRAATASRSTV
jgi:hypothetical protein